MIAEGRVALDGVRLETPATLLTSLHGVTVDGQPVKEAAPARLFRYHKPAGLLTAERDPAGRLTIYDRLPQGLPRVMPVGRLDLNTEGLLLLTTDGELKRELELPSSGVERSYRARAYGDVSQAQLEDLMLGIEIEGVRYGSINANLERRTGANLWIEMTLTEGKNREVRRVLEHLGLQVSRLIRTRYGPFWLGDLPVGDVDEIRQADLITFRTVLGKPGGGKAASNLQFAVRQRVEAPAPRPEPVDVVRVPRPDNRPGRGRPAREPERPTSRPVARPARDDRPRVAEPRAGGFTPRGASGRISDAPARSDTRPDQRFGRDDRAPAGKGRTDERPVRERRGPAGEGRAGSFAPKSGPGRPAGAPLRGEPRSGERPDRERRHPPGEARTGKFTPRVTPVRSDRPAREETRTVEKPARAARAKAHRDTLSPREGDFVDRPRTPRPSRGPAGGRGKPSPDKRPPRSRK